MEYTDLTVRIGPRIAENEYAVSTRTASLGEAKSTFVQPLSDEQLELFVLKVGLARRGVRRLHSPEWRAAQEFGQKLFRALFTNEIGGAFISAHNDAVRQGKGLRVRLTLDAPELANYPWEFLYDPSNSQFLSLFEDTPILRYIELPRPILPLSVTPPLRILALTASPSDYEPLDIARERRNLAQALDGLRQRGLVELDWLPAATLDSLRAQLLKRPYHIFHFIGHGGFDRANEDGVLVFEDMNGASNRVSGERLAVTLGNHRTLRLAILNACEGARTSQQDPFAGTAMTLLRTGNLPAVVAMQFEITDTAAIDFANGFYSAIATGRPVDAAVGQGRQTIFAHNNDVEWSTPVLYLRSTDGKLFEMPLVPADETLPRDAEATASKQSSEIQTLPVDRAQKQLDKPGAQQGNLAQEKVKPESVRTQQPIPQTNNLTRAEDRKPAPTAARARIQSLNLLFALSVGVWTIAGAIAAMLFYNNDGAFILTVIILGGAGMWFLVRASRFSTASPTGVIIIVGYVLALAVTSFIAAASINAVREVLFGIVSPLYNSMPDSSVDSLKNLIAASLYGALGGLLGGAVMWWQLRRGERLV